jgi:hypothetical protein
MSMVISPLRTGFALGGMLGLYHLVWSALVALGWAQPVIDFVLQIHMIALPLQVQPFNLGLAATLVAVTAAIGFVLGLAFAAFWNWLHVGARSGFAVTVVAD